MRFDKPKGQRLHKHFWGITTTTVMWWSVDDNKWIDDIPDNHGTLSTNKPCKTLRAFRRHLRKHPEIRGKAILVSKFVGYDVYA